MVGAVVAAPGTGGGLGGRDTTGTDGVTASAEVVAANDDGVTRKAAAADAADELVASAAASVKDAATDEEGANAAMSRARLLEPQRGAERLSTPPLAR